MVSSTKVFIRYPGGKVRMLNFLIPQIVNNLKRKRLVEPFAGSGAVFFALNPKRALLSDINSELIDLYRGIRRYPIKAWKIFKRFPSTKKGYYQIRDRKHNQLDLATKAARTLYLNRTCFKGMWRHNSNGDFNIGYGGQDRRWVVNKEILLETSRKLRRATLKCCDFEKVIDMCHRKDFIFVDPPYRPGERQMNHEHYSYGKFTFDEHKRLAATLKRASKKGIKWALTISSHKDILRLYTNNQIVPMPKGTGKKPGILTKKSGEVLICNYKEIFK